MHEIKIVFDQDNIDGNSSVEYGDVMNSGIIQVTISPDSLTLTYWRLLQSQHFNFLESDFVKSLNGLFPSIKPTSTNELIITDIEEITHFRLLYA